VALGPKRDAPPEHDPGRLVVPTVASTRWAASSRDARGADGSAPTPLGQQMPRRPNRASTAGFAVTDGPLLPALRNRSDPALSGSRQVAAASPRRAQLGTRTQEAPHSSAWNENDSREGHERRR
jgi:hypothetical protein